jgi:CobQ-like glutamine amidotransferase family enzyme
MAKYVLNLAHLYGDLLNTYGDVGNILALQYYAKQMDTEIQTTVISTENDFHADDFDLAFFGGGQDYEQVIVSKDIQNKKAEIQKFIEADKPMLAICGGYQLLGHYYLSAQGKKISGIGVLNHYTLNQNNNRFIGDITIKSEDTGEVYHGFENHNGMTFLGDGEKPLGTVVSGNGNNDQDNSEGAIYKQTYCSYFHGPVLTRNGLLAKRMILKALHNKYPDVDFTTQEQYEVQPTF